MCKHQGVGREVVHINAHLRALEYIVVEQLAQAVGQRQLQVSIVGYGVGHHRVLGHDAVGAHNASVHGQYAHNEQ